MQFSCGVSRQGTVRGQWLPHCQALQRSSGTPQELPKGSAGRREGINVLPVTKRLGENSATAITKR